MLPPLHDLMNSKSYDFKKIYNYFVNNTFLQLDRGNRCKIFYACM